MKSMAAVAVIALMGALPSSSPVQDAPPEITIIAHRCNGSGIYTENTSVGCVNAAANGARILDGDIRITSTGNPVILHNADLGVFGCPEKLIAEVSTTVAGRCLSAANGNIITLTQFRDTVRATGTRASLEPKIVPTAAEWSRINSTLAPIQADVLLNSFDLGVLAAAYGYGYGWIALNTTNDVTSVPAHVGIVIQNAANIDAANVALLRAQGVAVWCYSCNTPEVWTSMVSMGVTGFATDNHRAAQSWLLTTNRQEP
jgi:glycerophosphoryl diester phosphodiesterase